MPLISLKIALEQTGGIGEIGITGGIANGLGVYTVIHPVQGEVHFTLTKVKPCEGVWCAVGVYTCGDAAIVTLLPVLFQDDIEDTRAAAGGVVFGGGVGDDFYALDGIGGDLVEGKGGGPAIDEDGRSRTAKCYVAIDVDVDGRHVTHDVNACSACADDILCDVEDLLIELELHGRCLGRDGGGLQLSNIGCQLDCAQVLVEGRYACVRIGTALPRGCGGVGGLCRHDRNGHVLGLIACGRDANDQRSDDGEVLEIEFAVGFGVHTFYQHKFFLLGRWINGGLQDDCRSQDGLAGGVGHFAVCTTDRGGCLTRSGSAFCARLATAGLSCGGLCEACQHNTK